MSRQNTMERGERIDISHVSQFEISQGFHNALAEVYSRSFRSLALTAFCYVKDMETAQDIIQNLFLRLLETPPTLLNSHALRSYLQRATINHSINHLLREKRLLEHHERIAEELKLNLAEEPSEDGLKLKLHDAIDSLPPKCKRVLKMSRFQNLQYKEIAEQLGVAEKTVENHIVSAYKILRKRFQSSDRVARATARKTLP